MQISHSICPKISEKSILRTEAEKIGKILRKLCEWKKVKIIEAEVCPDHIHMLVEIPPKYSVSSFMGYLKGKSSLMIYEKYPELKYKYRNREFWCRGYYVDTAGKNAKKIYLRDRRKHASPNSAQTEAVMAGALDIQLAGDAWYFGELHKKPYIGDSIRKVEIEDIIRSHKLMYAGTVLSLVVFGLVRVLVCVFI